MSEQFRTCPKQVRTRPNRSGNIWKTFESVQQTSENIQKRLKKRLIFGGEHSDPEKKQISKDLFFFPENRRCPLKVLEFSGDHL